MTGWNSPHLNRDNLGSLRQDLSTLVSWTVQTVRDGKRQSDASSRSVGGWIIMRQWLVQGNIFLSKKTTFIFLTVWQQNSLKHRDVLFFPRGQLSANLRRRGRLPCARCFGQLCFFKISQNETKSSKNSRPSRFLFWRLEKTEDKSGVKTETLWPSALRWKDRFYFYWRSIYTDSSDLKGVEGSRYTQAFKKCLSWNKNTLGGEKKNPDGLYTESVCRKSSTYSTTCKCLTYNLNVTWEVRGFPTITDW